MLEKKPKHVFVIDYKCELYVFVAAAEPGSANAVDGGETRLSASSSSSDESDASSSSSASSSSDSSDSESGT